MWSVRELPEEGFGGEHGPTVHTVPPSRFVLAKRRIATENSRVSEAANT
jgi:hypothetical protein